MSKQQFVVALSTIEAEYMAATHACKEVVWHRRLSTDIGFDVGQVELRSDSQSAICLANNLAYNVRSKHIDVQFHFVCIMVEDGKVILNKVDTQENVADALTKLVSTHKFRWCSNSIGLSTHPSL